MKITDIVHKSYQEVREMDQFDLKKMPVKPKWYLQLLAWVLAFPETFQTKTTIRKHNMDGIKGPYILLCNHNSFLDFKVATRAVFPRKSSYIVAIDGYIGREQIMRNVGCFMKRKFVSDTAIVKQIRQSLHKNRNICQIYPEARYSLVGTNSPLPESLGKLCKMMEVPIVTIISHGHHLRQPFWNLKKRQLKTSSDLTQIITKEELKDLSVDDINARIKAAFKYDDYRYQLDNKILIDNKDIAEGLHKSLYKCPHCLTEHQMTTKDNKLWCKSCHETYEMNGYGQLQNTNGNTMFSHIPDWFEWQREKVREEILNNQYLVEIDVEIDMLPNSTGFYRIGKGKLIHNQEGYTLITKDLNIHKTAISMFGVHIEFDYFGRGDGISFSTIKDTFYLYPVDQTYSVTKFHFATEELYDLTTKNMLNN